MDQIWTVVGSIAVIAGIAITWTQVAISRHEKRLNTRMDKNETNWKEQFGEWRQAFGKNFDDLKRDLREDINGSEIRLRGEIQEIKQDLRDEMKEIKQDLQDEMKEIKQSLSST